MKKILSVLLISSSLVFASNNNNTVGLDTIVGATIGVIIGNQIGRGKTKDIARVAGGLIGASIANNSRNSGYSNNNYNYDRRDSYVRDDYYSDNYYDRGASNIIVVYNNSYNGPRHRYYDRPYKNHHRKYRQENRRDSYERYSRR